MLKSSTKTCMPLPTKKNCFIMCVFVTLVKSAVKNKYSLVENQSTDEKKIANDNKLTVFSESVSVRKPTVYAKY